MAVPFLVSSFLDGALKWSSAVWNLRAQVFLNLPRLFQISLHGFFHEVLNTVPAPAEGLRASVPVSLSSKDVRSIKHLRRLPIANTNPKQPQSLSPSCFFPELPLFTQSHLI